MRLTYARQTRLAPIASTALFVDAEYVRRCAARSHEMISGSRIRASRVSIDACQISRFLDSLIVDFELEASRSPEVVARGVASTTPSAMIAASAGASCTTAAR